MPILEIALIPLLKSGTLATFVSEIGPILVASLLFSCGLFFLWYFEVLHGVKQREQGHWLETHKDSIQNYVVVDRLTETFGQSVPCCRNCGDTKMQLWDHEPEQLLVVRCRSCKMTYTFSKKCHTTVEPMLARIKDVEELIRIMVGFDNPVLERLLYHKLGMDLHRLQSGNKPLELLYFEATYGLEETSGTSLDVLLKEWEKTPSDHPMELVS